MAEDPGKKGIIKLIIERKRFEGVKKDYRKHVQEKKPSELQRMTGAPNGNFRKISVRKTI